MKLHGAKQLGSTSVLLNNIDKLDDSAFFWTQSYITEICYFEYLQSLFLDGKNHFSPQFRAI